MREERLGHLQGWGLAVLRLVVGITFLLYGVQKLFALGVGGVTGYFDGLGVPAASIVAVGIIALELVGGAALILGLFTRPFAALFAAEMLVAIPLVHLANGFFVADGGYGHALLTLAASATLVLAGAGAPSLDRILSGRGNAKTASSGDPAPPRRHPSEVSTPAIEQGGAKMKKNARLLLTMALVGVMTLGATAAAVAQDTGTARIYEVPGSGSGVTGSATVAPEGEDATLVTVRLEGNVEPDVGYPAHLHEGTYKNGKFDFDPKPSYDLNDAVGGASETRLEVPFEELVATDYLIAAHLPTGSGQGSGTDVAGRSYGPAIAAGPIEVGTNLPDTGGPALPSLPATALGVAAIAGAVLLMGVRLATPRRGN